MIVQVSGEVSRLLFFPKLSCADLIMVINIVINKAMKCHKISFWEDQKLWR